MKKETKNWLATFLAGFLATVLGIALTFGIDSWINAGKRKDTARLLAEQIVEKMDQTQQQLHEYQVMYDAIDSTATILHDALVADTLERVDQDVVSTFIFNSLGAYVQVEIDAGMDAYRSEILNTIGNVDLLGHIDTFYNIAHQCEKISGQVIEQKQIVSDLVYLQFYGKAEATQWDVIRYLHELPEFVIFYSRLQYVRLGLKEGDEALLAELKACQEILGLEREEDTDSRSGRE